MLEMRFKNSDDMICCLNVVIRSQNMHELYSLLVVMVPDTYLLIKIRKLAKRIWLPVSWHAFLDNQKKDFQNIFLNWKVEILILRIDRFILCHYICYKD